MISRLLLVSVLFCLNCSNSNKLSLTKTKYQIRDSTNSLSGKIENLELTYTIFGCACPNWIRLQDQNRKDSTINILDLHFFLEPSLNAKVLPIYFDAFRHYLRVKGQFYNKKDYPKGSIVMEEPIEKARVFQYSEIEVVDIPNKIFDSKIDTLTLSYGAFSCPCAQWIDSKNVNDKERVKYWLEPANNILISADTLFNGINYPVQIQVTGQVVCENGFPRSEKLAKVSHNESSKVFRYSSIKVIKKGED